MEKEENKFILFQLLKIIRDELDITNVIKGSTILYDVKQKYFYSPEKFNKLYLYISYEKIFNTMFPLQTQIRGIFRNIRFDSNDNTLIIQIREKIKLFKNSINTIPQIDEFINSIAITSKFIRSVNDTLQIASNKDQFIYVWDDYYKQLINILDESLIDSKDMYNLDNIMYDIITKLIDCYDKTKYATDKLFSFNPQNPFDQEFWNLPEDKMIKLINNYEKITNGYVAINRMQRHQDTSKFDNEDIKIRTQLIMIDSQFRWTFHNRYMLFVSTGNLLEIKKLLVLCDKFTKDNIIDSIKSDEWYNYILKIIDPVKRLEFIEGIKNLSDVQTINNMTELKIFANKFNDKEIIKCVKYIHKRQAVGDLDKNNKPRPIMSIYFKDIAKYTKDPDFITLSPTHKAHLENALGLITLNIEEIRTNYKDDKQVFTLESVPGLIFKKLQPKEFKRRCKNTAFSRKLVEFYDLNMLIVPKFGFITLDKFNIIYEEIIDVDPSQYVQELYYTKYAHKMHNAIKQLTMFCCLTGLDDVVWRNIPLDNKSINNNDSNNDVKIVLVDLGETTNYHNSIFGGAWGRLGLIRCVDSSLFNIIRETYYQITGKVSSDDFEENERMRSKELEFDKNIYKYFEEHNITDNNKYQHIICDNSDILKFDDYEEKDKIILKNLCVDFITCINNYLDWLSDKNEHNEDILTYRYTLKFIREISTYFIVNRYSLLIPKRSIDVYSDVSKKCDNIKQSYYMVSFKELERNNIIFKISDNKIWV